MSKEEIKPPLNIDVQYTILRDTMRGITLPPVNKTSKK